MKIEVPAKVPRRKLMDTCSTITKDLERGVYCEVKDNSISIAGLDREQVNRASREIITFFKGQLAESECSLHMTLAEQFIIETMSPLTQLKEFKVFLFINFVSKQMQCILIFYLYSTVRYIKQIYVNFDLSHLDIIRAHFYCINCTFTMI